MPKYQDKVDNQNKNRGGVTRKFCYERTDETNIHLRKTYPSERRFKGVRHCPSNHSKEPYEAWVQYYPQGPNYPAENQFLGRFPRPHDAANAYDVYVRKNPQLGLKPNFGDA